MLEIKHRKRIASENSASGIGPTFGAMEELIEQKAATKRKLGDDLSKGLQMWLKSQETYGETMHRNGETLKKS